MTKPRLYSYGLLGQLKNLMVAVEQYQVLSVDSYMYAFIDRMRAKYEKKLPTRGNGWMDAPPGGLDKEFWIQVSKGDPVDVGNVCMMMDARGEKVPTAWWAPFLLFLQNKNEWARRTFPTCTVKGILAHIRLELIEVEKKPDDLEEWVDVILLALDGAHRAGYSPQQVVKELQRKQRVNEDRQWIPNAEGFSEHKRD